MSFLNRDVKSNSPQGVTGLFAMFDKQLEWDHLFIDFAKAAKGKYENDYYSPLFALEGEIMEEYGEELSQQLMSQINQCLMYAIKQRLTQEEQDALLDILAGDITTNKKVLLDINADAKDDFRKKLVADIRAMGPVTWNNVAEQFTLVLGDPSFDDRVTEILTRYKKSLGMQINGILEDCVKKNFLQKLPADINARLKALMTETIQRTANMKPYSPKMLSGWSMNYDPNQQNLPYGGIPWDKY